MDAGAPRRKVQTKSLEPFRAAILRYAGPPEAVGAAFARLRSWVRAQGLEPTGPLSGYFFDRPEEPSDTLRVEVRAPLPNNAVLAPKEGVTIVDVPACTVAWCTYRGLPMHVQDMVDAVLGWMDLNDLSHRAHDHIQLFQETPRDEGDDWTIEVQIPIHGTAPEPGPES